MRTRQQNLALVKGVSTHAGTGRAPGRLPPQLVRISRAALVTLAASAGCAAPDPGGGGAPPSLLVLNAGGAWRTRCPRGGQDDRASPPPGRRRRALPNGPAGLQGQSRPAPGGGGRPRQRGLGDRRRRKRGGPRGAGPHDWLVVLAAAPTGRPRPPARRCLRPSKPPRPCAAAPCGADSRRPPRCGCHPATALARRRPPSRSPPVTDGCPAPHRLPPYAPHVDRVTRSPL